MVSSRSTSAPAPAAPTGPAFNRLKPFHGSVQVLVKQQLMFRRPRGDREWETAARGCRHAYITYKYTFSSGLYPPAKEFNKDSNLFNVNISRWQELFLLCKESSPKSLSVFFSEFWLESHFDWISWPWTLQPHCQIGKTLVHAKRLFFFSSFHSHTN